MILIGDGGHAGNLKDIIELRGVRESRIGHVLAFGGMTCEALENRHTQMTPSQFYPNLIHPSAVLSPHVYLEDGIQIMAGAVVQHKARIGQGSILNTRAIVEHDADIGKGCHVAPGAVVLGDAKVGDFCFVGANAVVVQGSTVPPRTFIKAGSVWKSR